MECIELNTENFESTLAAHGGMVVMFGRDNCRPCREQKEPFFEYAAACADRAFGYVDVQADPGLESRFGIEALPAYAVFDGALEITYNCHYLKFLKQDIEQGKL